MKLVHDALGELRADSTVDAPSTQPVMFESYVETVGGREQTRGS